MVATTTTAAVGVGVATAAGEAVLEGVGGALAATGWAASVPICTGSAGTYQSERRCAFIYIFWYTVGAFVPIVAAGITQCMCSVLYTVVACNVYSHGKAIFEAA